MSDVQQGPDWWQASDGKWYPPGSPADATSQATAPPAEPRRWKTWQLVAAVLVALLVGVGIGSAGGTAGEDDTHLAAELEEKVTTTTRAPVTTTTTTTSAPERTTTIREPTTTTAAPTTTTTPPTNKDTFKAKFDATRPSVLGVLEQDNNIESVDKFVYDTGSGTVLLDVSSAWATDENQANGAWEITRAMAVLWEPGQGIWTDPGFTPNFTLVNSAKRYACPAAFMLKLGGTEAGRSDFTATCR